MPKPKKSLEERFWSKVNKAETCWLWTGAKTDSGYGAIWDESQGIMARAHRISFMWAFGDVPEGVLVLHRCDVRSCIRPDHLFLGDHKANYDDMVSKGRQKYPVIGDSEDLPWSKLSWEKVRAIRASAQIGETHSALAEKFNVTKSTITKAVNHKTWKTKETKDHEDQ